RATNVVLRCRFQSSVLTPLSLPITLKAGKQSRHVEQRRPLRRLKSKHPQNITRSQFCGPTRYSLSKQQRVMHLRRFTSWNSLRVRFSEGSFDATPASQANLTKRHTVTCA